MKTKEGSHSAKILKGLFCELHIKIEEAKNLIKEKKVAKQVLH